MKKKNCRSYFFVFIQISLACFMIATGYSTLTNKANLLNVSGYSKIGHYYSQESNK